jgi:hypothetical protein
VILSVYSHAIIPAEHESAWRKVRQILGFTSTPPRSKFGLPIYLSALRANDHPRAAPRVFELQTQKFFSFCDFARCAKITSARSASECRICSIVHARVVFAATGQEEHV